MGHAKRRESEVGQMAVRQARGIRNRERRMFGCGKKAKH
jgi:hypothetical protein